LFTVMYVQILAPFMTLVDYVLYTHGCTSFIQFPYSASVISVCVDVKLFLLTKCRNHRNSYCTIMAVCFQLCSGLVTHSVLGDTPRVAARIF
jgi:hypothetical protein